MNKKGSKQKTTKKCHVGWWAKNSDFVTIFRAVSGFQGWDRGWREVGGLRPGLGCRGSGLGRLRRTGTGRARAGEAPGRWPPIGSRERRGLPTRSPHGQLQPRHRGMRMLGRQAARITVLIHRISRHGSAQWASSRISRTES